MKTNPVYKREIMVSARSIRLALVLLVFNGILALVALLICIRLWHRFG